MGVVGRTVVVVLGLSLKFMSLLLEVTPRNGKDMSRQRCGRGVQGFPPSILQALLKGFSDA